MLAITSPTALNSDSAHSVALRSSRGSSTAGSFGAHVLYETRRFFSGRALMRDRFEDIYNTAVAHMLLSSSFQRCRISCLHHSNAYCRRVRRASTEICRFLLVAANANIGLHTSSLVLIFTGYLVFGVWLP